MFQASDTGSRNTDRIMTYLALMRFMRKSQLTTDTTMEVDHSSQTIVMYAVTLCARVHDRYVCRTALAERQMAKQIVAPQRKVEKRIAVSLGGGWLYHGGTSVSCSSNIVCSNSVEEAVPCFVTERYRRARKWSFVFAPYRVINQRKYCGALLKSSKSAAD